MSQLGLLLEQVLVCLQYQQVLEYLGQHKDRLILEYLVVLEDLGHLEFPEYLGCLNNQKHLAQPTHKLRYK